MIIRMAAQEAMVTSTGSAAMALRGNTTIQGPGFLSVKSTGSYGIYVTQGATLTVENITLDVLGGGQYGSGICGGDYSSKEKLIIRNATVWASSSSLGAIDSFHGGITLEDCSIMEPEGGQIKTNTSGVPYRIVDKNGNMAKTVKIVAKPNPADVNRDGAVDSADIVAVIKEMPEGDMKADVNGDKVIDSADIVAVIKAMK